MDLIRRDMLRGLVGSIPRQWRLHSSQNKAKGRVSRGKGFHEPHPSQSVTKLGMYVLAHAEVRHDTIRCRYSCRDLPGAHETLTSLLVRYDTKLPR